MQMQSGCGKIVIKFSFQPSLLDCDDNSTYWPFFE